MRIGAHSTKARKVALADAEARLNLKGRGKAEPVMVKLFPSEIKERPELFQPREFSSGLRGVDKDHVKKLTGAIGRHGELDQPLVIKLGRNWVCVDGHHRLAAYKAAKYIKQIYCEWFGGNVRSAMDESMHRNKKDRLNVPQADRLEEAWKRTLIGGWSKAALVETCSVSDGSVAFMRRVLILAQRKGDVGADLFRKRLGGRLDETSWAQIKMVYAGVTETERTDETRAAQLAKQIRSRLSNLLSRDPAVTARALTIHDPELPAQLVNAWKASPTRASTLDED